MRHLHVHPRALLLVVLLPALALACSKTGETATEPTPVALDCAPGSGETLAAWSFNDGASAASRDAWPEEIPADFGCGVLRLSDWSGDTEDFEGTDLNARPDDKAGAALALVSGTQVKGNEGSFEIEFSTRGRRGVLVTFATRSTFLGFNHHTFSVSVDGERYFLLDEERVEDRRDALEWQTRVLDLRGFPELDDQPRVILRYTLDGSEATAANNRIDNLRVEAS